MLVSAVTSAVVSAAILFGTGVGTSMLSSETVVVPDLRGLSHDSALTRLAPLRLRLVVAGEQHDPEIAENAICQQQPRPGSQLLTAEAISVHTSLGQPLVEVPDVTGRTVAEALRLLDGAGLRAGSVDRTGTGSADTVVSTHPEPAELIARGAHVDLVAVPERRLVSVPSVVGESIRQARELIVNADLSIGRIRTRFDDRQPPFITLSQDPEAGSQVEPGTDVDLVRNEE